MAVSMVELGAGVRSLSLTDRAVAIDAEKTCCTERTGSRYLCSAL